MPVFVRGDKQLLYVHVPKTGGTYIEDTLILNGWRVDLLDRGSSGLGFEIENHRPISPQHWHAEILTRVLAIENLDFVFMTVRHPFSRFASEYAWRNPESDTDSLSEKKVEEWWEMTKNSTLSDARFLDNHIRPQSDFYIDGVDVLKFEDGPGRLHKLAREKSLPSAISKNSSWSSSKRVPISLDLKKKLRSFYDVDFEGFGY